MTKKRTVISQDYDGCYSITTPVGLKAELDGSNRAAYSNPSNSNCVDSLNNMRTYYHDYLTEITLSADAVSVYVGSDRQSVELDRLNAEIHKNGSVFFALMELCHTRSTDKQPWTFEPFLLSDGKERGAALMAMRPIHGESELDFNARQLPAPIKTKSSKIPLLIAQMQDARREYPEDEIAFYFVDDRQDLLDDILRHLKPEDIPPGLTLHISKFDYIGVITNQPGSHELVATLSRQTAPHLSQQGFFSNSTESSAAAAAPAAATAPFPR